MPIWFLLLALLAESSAIHLLALGKGDVELPQFICGTFGIQPCVDTTPLDEPVLVAKSGDVEVSFVPSIEVGDLASKVVRTLVEQLIAGCAANSSPLHCVPDRNRKVDVVVISLPRESVKKLKEFLACWLFCGDQETQDMHSHLSWLNSISKNNTITLVPFAEPNERIPIELLSHLSSFAGKTVLHRPDHPKENELLFKQAVFAVPNSLWLGRLRVAITVLAIAGVGLIGLIKMQQTDATVLEVLNVELPHTHFIPVPLSELEEHLLAQTTDKEQWNSFFMQLNCLISGNADLTVTKLAQGLKGATNQSEINTFLMGLCELLTAAEYSPLSCLQLQYAIKGKFLFSLPTTLDWSKHCSATLLDFFKVFNPYGDPEDIPEYAHKGLLIFTRGVSNTTYTSYFWEEKFDHLLLTLVANVQKLLQRSPLQRHKKTPAPKKPQASRLGYCKGRASIWGTEQVLSGDETPKPTTLAQRQSLEEVIASKGFWTVLFQQVTVTEPVFDNVLLFWREAGSEQAASAPFQLRCFEAIPFADIDTLLPIQSVLLRPLHRFIFIFQALSALWLVLASMEITHVVTSGWLFFVCGLMLAGGQQAYALLYSLQFYKQDYNNRLQTWITSHRVAQGPAVLAKLVADVKDQEAKEALLGYCMLAKQAGPVAVRELDRLCEEYLQQHFNVQVDFDVHGVLPALCALKLVRVEGGRCSVAQTPAEYLQRYPIALSLAQLLPQQR